MGNVLNNRSNLLAKHWNQVSPNTYRNAITDELIDSHHLPLYSEEQLAFNNNLLMKRASLSHPNVPKLIYFAPSSNPLCGSSSHAVTLYLEHTQPLAKVVHQPTISVCPCCCIMSALLYLSDRYGWFRVDESLVKGGLESGLQGKQAIVPKIWINSDLRLSCAGATTSQPEMCFQTVNLILSLRDRVCCLKESFPENIRKLKTMKEVAEAIYIFHNQIISQPSRKRIVSQYNEPSGQVLERTPPRQSNRNLITCKSNQTFQLQPQKLSFNNEGNQQFKRIPHPIQLQSKNNENPNQLSTGRTSRRVNFSFTDSLATPKNNKHPPLPTKMQESPSVAPKNNIGRQRINPNDSNKNIRVPQETLYTFVPVFRKQETDLFIQEEESESRLKQMVLGTDRDPSFSTLGTQQLQSSPIATLQRQPDPQPEHILSKQAPKQIPQQCDMNKKLVQDEKIKVEVLSQKESIPVDIELENEKDEKDEKQSQVNIQSIASGNNQKSNAFQIVSEYHLSLDPQGPLATIPIQHSLEYNGSEPGRSPPPTSVFSCKAPKIDHSNKDISFNCGQGGLNSEKHRSPIQPEKSQPQEKDFTKYLKNFQQVVLSESNLHAPRSERRYSSKQTHPEEFEEKEHLTYSNNPKRFKKTQPRSRQDYPPQSSSAMMKAPHLSREDDTHSIESQSSEGEVKRRKIMAKISSTEEVLRENRKKLQRLRLEKDLQKEKSLIKKEMESLLVSNMMVDESNRIKAKVKHKKETFAQLKAEASKILEDLDF